jgi:hypothetical protein
MADFKNPPSVADEEKNYDREFVMEFDTDKTVLATW